MAEERTPRDEDVREMEGRPSDDWMPSNNLPTPKDQDGWAFRWIRTSMVGKSDNTNVSKKFREGWVPVKAEDHPELNVMSDIDSRFDGCVEVGGLLLCKAPVEMVRRRQQYQAKRASDQMRAVDENMMREHDHRMPWLAPERSSRTSRFGRD